MAHKIKVWDLPIRLFHWTLLVAVVTSFLSVEVFEAIDTHVISGIVVCVLLVFRIIWGFIGSSTARFWSFVPTASKLLRYLQSSDSEKKSMVGHSPLGALSVFAMLVSLILQAGSGLFMDDEIFTTGPLNQFASQGLIDLAIQVHDVNSVVLQILIAMHILAILFYLLKNKINLIGPMITGTKWVQESEPVSQLDLGQTHWIRFLVVFMLSAVVGYWLYTL